MLKNNVATVPATKNAAPATPPPSTTTDGTSSPKAINFSTPGATQPFSEPFFPSTSSVSTPPIAPSSPTPSAAAPLKLTSSVPGGTPLNALSYVKQPSKPLLALEDSEYPSWLWNLTVDPNAPKSNMDGGIDLSAMTKKMRAKHERKQAKLREGMERPVPMHEQSRDLTSAEEGAMEYAQKRRELTHSMRGARRKDIREANFLRSM
ncbi:hypothetical protein LTR70_001162 [Exophiala xenobiotica]|uniref:Large ribosomal subunit protein mL54 n=1 Tax=Lithohypha guttulata TaxID=1690604 RepID=A0ABR0K849_9EURO|nr:hypothetical protein LTR24_005747 [Lithohypha guttulata]KAK5328137.1 hypothetical protein LTR70_001162 [Exophiala xenobiotica]